MSRQVGQILMESGMLSIDDLNEALETQKSTGQMLGEVLIDMGSITQEELEMALSFQDDDEE
jgi:predicted transcriptional regulator